MPRQPAGLRERKKEKTRQALASAAMRLFAERGYEATTVADIAAAAEVSTRTFFAYFPSKEDVFSTGTRERLDLVRQAFAAHAAALPPLTAMRATLDQIIETASGDLFAPDRNTRLRLLLERPELRARGTQLLFSAHQVLADRIRAGMPGLDGYGAVAAAGATSTTSTTSTTSGSMDRVLTGTPTAARGSRRRPIAGPLCGCLGSCCAAHSRQRWVSAG